MGKRRSSRELVIKFLYLVEMNEGDAEGQRREFWERNPCQADIQEFADALLDNIFQHREDIDACVEKCEDMECRCTADKLHPFFLPRIFAFFRLLD